MSEDMPINNPDQEIDELDAIFVDKNVPVDKKLIVEILKPFITIDNEGVINFTENYDLVNDNLKALIYLASKKAKVLRGILEKDKEAAGPKEVSENSGISEGSAKMALSRDFKKILIRVEGGYIIPNYNLKKVKEVITSSGNQKA